MTNTQFEQFFEEFWTIQYNAESDYVNTRDITTIKGIVATIDKNVFEKQTPSLEQVLTVMLAPELVDLLAYKAQIGFDVIVTESQKILIDRAKEYAFNDDRLSNFKSVASDMPISSVAFGWCLARKHLDSVINTIENKTPRNKIYWVEKLIDPINYCLLLSALIRDGEYEK